MAHRRSNHFILFGPPGAGKGTQGEAIANDFKLFKISTGDFFLWADQDDIRKELYIEKTLEILLLNQNAVLCHSDTYVFFNDPSNVFHVNCHLIYTHQRQH